MTRGNFNRAKNDQAKEKGRDGNRGKENTKKDVSKSQDQNKWEGKGRWSSQRPTNEQPIKAKIHKQQSRKEGENAKALRKRVNMKLRETRVYVALKMGRKVK